MQRLIPREGIIVVRREPGEFARRALEVDDDRRRKWLDLAQRFPSMTPDEQARMRARMSYWSSLTPEERVEARERYKRLQAMPADQRETSFGAMVEVALSAAFGEG